MSRKPLTTDQLITLAYEDQSIADLRRYFGVGLADGVLPPFTGGRFDTLSGGGDRNEVKDTITADDLIAVQLLSVIVPADVALDILLGDLGRALAAYLAKISTDVDLGSPRAQELLDGPASDAWHALEDERDVGGVTAGKLLARKRPRLVPVYDRVVRCALNKPPVSEAWRWFNDRFGDRDRALPQVLSSVRQAAGIDDNVAAPRVLDVILWMRHRDEHRLSGCTGLTAK